MNINYRFTIIYPQKPRFDNLKCKLTVSERRDRYRSVNIPEKQIDVFMQEFDDNKNQTVNKLTEFQDTLYSISNKLSKMDLRLDNLEKKTDKQEINFKNIENSTSRSNVFMAVLVSLILFSANNDTVVGKITGALLSKIPGI